MLTAEPFVPVHCLTEKLGFDERIALLATTELAERPTSRELCLKLIKDGVYRTYAAAQEWLICLARNRSDHGLEGIAMH
jgi:hypothetical protein